MKVVNGYDDVIYKAISSMALDLADLFEEYSDVYYDDGELVDPKTHDEDRPFQHIISEEGLEIMGDTFDDIEEDYRADVFQHLLCELEDRGIEYDLEQFKDTE